VFDYTLAILRPSRETCESPFLETTNVKGSLRVGGGGGGWLFRILNSLAKPLPPHRTH